MSHKGDRDRTTNKKQADENHDKIDWSKKNHLPDVGEKAKNRADAERLAVKLRAAK